MPQNGAPGSESQTQPPADAQTPDWGFPVLLEDVRKMSVGHPDPLVRHLCTRLALFLGKPQEVTAVDGYQSININYQSRGKVTIWVVPVDFIPRRVESSLLSDGVYVLRSPFTGRTIGIRIEDFNLRVGLKRPPSVGWSWLSDTLVAAFGSKIGLDALQHVINNPKDINGTKSPTALPV